MLFALQFKHSIEWFEIINSNCLDDEFNEINPLEALNLNKYELSEDEILKIKNGNFIQNNFDKKEGVVLLTKNNKLVSIANVSDNLIKPRKLFTEDK